MAIFVKVMQNNDGETLESIKPYLAFSGLAKVSIILSTAILTATILLILLSPFHETSLSPAEQLTYALSVILVSSSILMLHRLRYTRWKKEIVSNSDIHLVTEALRYAPLGLNLPNLNRIETMTNGALANVCDNLNDGLREYLKKKQDAFSENT